MYGPAYILKIICNISTYLVKTIKNTFCWTRQNTPSPYQFPPYCPELFPVKKDKEEPVKLEKVVVVKDQPQPQAELKKRLIPEEKDSESNEWDIISDST